MSNDLRLLAESRIQPLWKLTDGHQIPQKRHLEIVSKFIHPKKKSKKIQKKSTPQNASKKNLKNFKKIKKK